MTGDTHEPTGSLGASGAHLTVADLAARYGVPVTTVYQWNHRGVGPRRMTIGRRVYYRLADIEEWERKRTVPEVTS